MPQKSGSGQGCWVLEAFGGNENCAGPSSSTTQDNGDEERPIKPSARNCISPNRQAFSTGIPSSSKSSNENSCTISSTLRRPSHKRKSVPASAGNCQTFNWPSSLLKTTVASRGETRLRSVLLLKLAINSL